MAMVFVPLSGLSLPVRLRGMGVEHRQEPIRRPRGYPRHQWIQVRSGRLALDTEGVVAIARPGDGFYLPPDRPHAYRGEAEEVVVDWVDFDGPGVAGALAVGPLATGGIYRLASTGALDRSFAALWALVQSGAPGVQLSAGVYHLLMVLAEEASGGGRPSTSEGRGRLEPLLATLATRPSHPWTVEELAHLAGVSPQHLGRLFRRAVGQSPLDYLHGLRLDRALNLLIERPDLRVHEVGEAVGYTDANYFIRLFRRREGRTPGAFRKLHGPW